MTKPPAHMPSEKTPNQFYQSKDWYGMKWKTLEEAKDCGQDHNVDLYTLPPQSPDQGAVEALEKENRKLKFQSELDRRTIDRWVPCSDHRDKTKENHCYVCENETLKRKLEQALTRTPVWWGIDYGTRETSVVDGKVTHRDIEPPVTRPPLDLAPIRKELNKRWRGMTSYKFAMSFAMNETLDHLQAIRPDLFGGKKI